MTSRHRLGCFGARDQGRCNNYPTIRRDEVEARVLKALQEKLLNLMLDDEIAVEEGKAEIKALDLRRKDVQTQLENADEARPQRIPAHISQHHVPDWVELPDFRQLCRAVFVNCGAMSAI